MSKGRPLVCVRFDQTTIDKLEAHAEHRFLAPHYAGRATVSDIVRESVEAFMRDQILDRGGDRKVKKKKGPKK